MSTNNSTSSYDRQLQWRRNHQRRVDKIREKQIHETVPKFEPTIYSQQPVKDFEGSAREINDRSSKKFVERNLKAKGLDPNHYMNHGYIGGDDRIATETFGLKSGGSHEILSSKGSRRDRSLSPSKDIDDLSTSSDDVPIIEMFERERRKWQDEKEKLIQCIHLQQLELTQRSMAAHERALDIAKDFGKVISSFEERLVTVETNIQKEISSLRAITDSLLAASGKGMGQLPPPPPPANV